MNKCPKCGNKFSAIFMIKKYTGNSDEYWFCPNCNACLKFNQKRRFYMASYIFISIMLIYITKAFIDIQYAYLVFLILLFIFIIFFKKDRLSVLTGGFIVRHHDKEKIEFYSYDDWKQIKFKDEYDIISEER